MKKEKNIIVFFIITILVIIGFLYWNNQKELAYINSKLPEGIEITKTIFGRYKINNEIDNYSFTAPKEWQGILEAKYIKKQESKGYKFSSVNVKGEVSTGKVVAVVKIESKPDLSLLSQANLFFDAFDLQGELKEEEIKGIKAVTSQEVEGLMGIDASFFQKENNIYLVTCKSDKFIKEIIKNGDW
jgi:hypothetical protein